eukprot:gb/GFBE01027690.1/.p1 GENE.gb/GFBE01027690.1/~~gb/GFBE01027690.1/.p1  ORF type:complete len:542 (+),score=139.70 gb/GFBE01027690.1/:1-1626(+)
MRNFLLIVSFIAASARDATEQPAQAQVLMQSSSRLRGAKAAAPQVDAMSARQMITGQRYSDDDESCSAEGITPGVCALASLAKPPQSPAAFVSQKVADCDKQESADRLERALIAEIESALAGNHTGFDAAKLQSLEQELHPIFVTLPHEQPAADLKPGGLGYAAARYLLHQHFLRQHAWHVRGLNPAGDGRQPPDAKEALRSRVAGHLLEVMENKAGKQGLDLKMLAIFVATLEHLMHGDQRERLKQAWAVHDLRPDASTDFKGLVSVLEVFMAHYVYISQKVDSGYAPTLEEALKEVKTISRIYGGWPKVDSFIQEQVTKRQQASGSKLSFEDAASAADEVLLLFQEVSGAMCHDMERTFQQFAGGSQGRVKLADLRHAESGDLFRESVEYLKELGALDEKEQEPHVFMPNYMLGPSNCDGTTSFYDLCCPNACEGHKQQIERALVAASDSASVISEAVQQRLGAPIPADLLSRLGELPLGNGGEVLIHGRAFADWLHKVFPRDCPRPREADFKGMAGDMLPDANTDFQAASKVSSLFDW